MAGRRDPSLPGYLPTLTVAAPCRLMQRSENTQDSEVNNVKRALLIGCSLLFLGRGSNLAMKDDVVSFHSYVDSDICARLMLGPITLARAECSVQTYKQGSNPVLVRLEDNTVFDINKQKLIREHVGGFGEASGEAKVKSGYMKLQAFKPVGRDDIPSGPAHRLLDVQTYKIGGPAKLFEKIRHELALMAYVTNFDFISFTMVGDDVILTGWTVRDTNRSEAERRVRRVEGVNKITNNIEILPLGSIDMEIRAAARAALQRNLSRYFWSTGSDIKIVVKNGRIILLGSVASQQDFDIATIQCNSVSFAFHVFNLLRVTPPVPKDKG
jgi:hyperosmotically inducible protein